MPNIALAPQLPPEPNLLEHHLGRLEEKYQRQGFKSWRARVFRAQPRWDFLSYCHTFKKMPPPAIKWPKFHWVDEFGGEGTKMIERCLSPFHGNVGFDDLLKFLLNRFGLPDWKVLPKNIERKHCEHWEETFDLEKAVGLESDFLGDAYAMFQGKFTRQKNGYYPTPMSIGMMKAQMLFDEHKCSLDETVLDCCGGSGRLLLPASNHSLRLYYQDVDAVCCRIATVNAYMYMPQLAWPLPDEFFKKSNVIYLDRYIKNTLPRFRKEESDGSKRSRSSQSRRSPRTTRRDVPIPALPGSL